MMIKLNVSSYGLDHKPGTDAEKSRMKINTGCNSRTVTARDLASLITSGHTFSRCLAAGMSNKDFIQQQVVFTDIDNDKEIQDADGRKTKVCIDNPLTIAAALDICREHGIKPLLAYETFSSTPSWQRFRIGALLEEPVTDAETAKRLNRKFRALFRGADARADDVNHMLYGTSPLKAIWFDESEPVNPTSAIDALPVPTEDIPGSTAPRALAPETVSAPPSEMRDFLRDNLKSILGYFSARDRAEWVKVGYALKNEGFDFSVWHEWSMSGGSKYKSEIDCIINWNALHLDGRDVNGGYLIGEAKRRGWSATRATLSDSYKRKYGITG